MGPGSNLGVTWECAQATRSYLPSGSASLIIVAICAPVISTCIALHTAPISLVDMAPEPSASKRSNTGRKRSRRSDESLSSLVVGRVGRRGRRDPGLELGLAAATLAAIAAFSRSRRVDTFFCMFICSFESRSSSSSCATGLAGIVRASLRLGEYLYSGTPNSAMQTPTKIPMWNMRKTCGRELLVTNHVTVKQRSYAHTHTHTHALAMWPEVVHTMHNSHTTARGQECTKCTRCVPCIAHITQHRGLRASRP